MSDTRHKPGHIPPGHYRPPTTEPVPPETVPPTSGIPAKRIASLIELFGVNTFSSLDEHNVWGSWPADYRPESVIAGLRYMLGDSGFSFRLREYHYAGREAMQREWLRAITTELPDTWTTLCVGANGSVDDVTSMVLMMGDPLLGIQWLEGLNEPNTNFGSGEVPFETTLAIQRAVFYGAGNRTMGPSIVAGMPHPEGWIEGYCGTPEQLAALNAQMGEGNGHYYPPGAPDLPSTGFSVNEYIGGLWTAYAQKTIHLTEFHPTLYNNAGHKPDQPGWDGDRDAFYTLTTLLRCAQNGTQGLWWYALYDYGTTYLCGLFPKDHANEPRPTATALQSLCTICADRGDRHHFEPGLLDIDITGLTAEIEWDVYQASDGRYIVPIWYAATELRQGTVVTARISFSSTKASVTVYEPLLGVAEVARQETVDQLELELRPGVVLLVIR